MNELDPGMTFGNAVRKAQADYDRAVKPLAEVRDATISAAHALFLRESAGALEAYTEAIAVAEQAFIDTLPPTAGKVVIFPDARNVLPQP